MITMAKFKGYNATEECWFCGGVVFQNGNGYIVRDGGDIVRCCSICESIGAADKDGTEVYEDDLIAVKDYIDARCEDGEWCEYRHKELILFRVERSRFGFYAVEVRGGKPYEEYGLGWVASEGKVVGSLHDCEDVGELYEKLEKEMIEND